MTQTAPPGTHRAEATPPPNVVGVLLVDDDADVRSLLEVMLDEDERFAVVGHASDGAEAVRLAARVRPDAVVLDLHMPCLDALTVLSRLRELLPAARIVVVSAVPDPYTLLDAVQRGADCYLDKSRAWRELMPMLTSLCAQV